MQPSFLLATLVLAVLTVVLIHEMGHAAALLLLGAPARVRLGGSAARRSSTCG